MFCPFCGSEVPDETKLCPVCNKNIIAARMAVGAANAKQAAEQRANGAPTPPSQPSPQEDAAPTNEHRGANKRPPVKIIAIAAAAVLAIVVVAAIIVINSKAVATFLPGYETSDVEPEQLNIDAEFTMPECPFTREGYDFYCWEASDGTQYEPDEALPSHEDGQSFTAIWEPITLNATFDANGAKGSMDKVEVNYDEEIELPKCKFDHPSCSFRCWANEDTGEEYEPGDKITLQEDVTLVAQWDLDPKKCLKEERYFTTKAMNFEDKEGYYGLLFARNTSDQNVWVDATFSFLDANGKVVGTDRDSTRGYIAPGDLALLCATSMSAGIGADDASDISYEFSLEEYPEETEPLSKQVTVREISCEYNKLTIELENTTDSEVYVQGVVAYGDALEGEGFIYFPQLVGKIGAGEKKSIEFEEEGWTNTTNRQYFLYG